jgi:3-isopropylmalate/(R)-2-methylmalate dehydratase large subunit
MGMTIAEKILSRNNVAGVAARAGDYVDCRLDGLLVSEAYEYVAEVYSQLGFPAGPPRIWDKDNFYLMTEHHQPAPTVHSAARNKVARDFARRSQLPHFYDSECGICHQMMFDHGHVRPGRLILGTDSHTTIYGALNAAGTGIGSEEAAYAAVFGEMWLRVPETIKVTLTGVAPPYPIGKDVVLTLAAKFGDAFALYRALEYEGSALASLSMDSRMCIACHGVELGAKFAFFPADHVAGHYLNTDLLAEAVYADDDAEYHQSIELDVRELGFPVARPHRFDNVVPVEQVRGVKIDQALVGSCANGRLEDLEFVARMLKQNRVSPHVRLFVEPASWGVYRRCLESGAIAAILDAGAQVLQPGCWICESLGCVLADGEVCVTCTTRNYLGRKGSRKADVYLAGPAAVVAAAIAGELIDPREVLGGLDA